MATPIAAADAAATALFALPDLEAQLIYMGQLLAARQNTYNAANTTAPKNAISINPNFAAGTITLQAVLPLATDAVVGFNAAKVSSVFTGV